MKTLLLVLLFPIFLHAQKSTPLSKTAKTTVAPQARPGFTIMGTLAGLKDSTMVFLSQQSNPANRVAVSYSKKGAFTLKGQIPFPDLYQLSFMGYPQQVDLFIDNQPVILTGSVQSLKDIKITGSPVNDDFKLYETRFNPLKNRLNEVANLIRITPAGTSRDSLIALFEVDRKKVVSLVDAFVNEKPSSPVTSFLVLITSQIGGDLDALEARFKKLTGAAKNTFYAAQLEKSIYDARNPKPGTEGTMAIDFSQPDTASKPVSLFSFKGKYVLVDFWASWCKPCRMENPAVVNAFNTFKGKNFTVLGVSLDQSRENWLQAIKDDNLTWTHVSDLKAWQNDAAQLYGIGSIPSNMLIDPSGKIIARDLRGEALHEVLEKILK